MILALGLSAIERNVYPELKTVTMFAFNEKEADGLAAAIELAGILAQEKHGRMKELGSKEMDLKKEVASISDAVEASVPASVKRKQQKDRRNDNDDAKKKTNGNKKKLDSNVASSQEMRKAQPQDAIVDEKERRSKPQKGSECDLL
mmetsp:Transcript_13145/g.18230  ORF Transcript_13145/g.18230 Transcript_13145/m.18230 type:complete len:146 (+) Transcript_13145:172-609(+)